ncbi:MAG: cyclic nucleotide-binding domain-containing protein [Hyphomicrobiaceae bacterium]|nr:cyclic nucleotide-binding domain-containing protein [Hyphomicrobiaceae bacterium]
MSVDRITTPLQRVALFASLKPHQLEEIALRAEKLRFRAGDVISHRGAPADGAYLIVSGQAECLDGQGGVEREPIDEGSIIGEMAMLIDHEYRSTVVARDRVLCLKINRATLVQQMLEDPTVADSLHEEMTRRLRRTAEELRRIDAVLANSWSGPPPASGGGFEGHAGARA